MKLADIFEWDANRPLEQIIIVGVNPIIDEIVNNPRLFYNMLNTNEKLTITILYESDTENFNQSLFFDRKQGDRKIDYDRLQTYHARLLGSSGGKKTGFIKDVLSYNTDGNKRCSMESRIRLLQNNLRNFVNLIIKDSIIYYSFTTTEYPSLEMYSKLERAKANNDKNDLGNNLYEQLQKYVQFLLDNDTGGKYLSVPGDELIELYDNHSYPRGIYPRKAFYSTDYQRYSV
jgi:hypothetical protein